jgi:hypothetical protein
MFNKLHNISRIWRLCIVLCVPFALAVGAYYSTLEGEPPIPPIYYKADKDYVDRQNLHIVYDAVLEKIRPAAAHEAQALLRQGYDLRFYRAYTVYLPPGMSQEAKQLAYQDMREEYDSVWERKLYRKLGRAVRWSLIAFAPFAVFWVVVFAVRWVRSGS